MAESADTRAETAGAAEDRNLRRSLGMWQLTAIGFSGVIGSGWLLGAMYAAQLAGPEAIVAWLVGGAALMLIALTMADLGAARPESGGLVRWPYYSSGRLVATIAGAQTDLFSGPDNQLLQAELQQPGFALVRKGFVLTPPSKPINPPTAASPPTP